MDENKMLSDTEAEDITDRSDTGGQEDSWPESWEEPETSGADKGADAPEEKFSLRYLGETRELGRDETVRLAQKGMDYDRIRRERDMMKPRLRELEGLLGSVAERSGMEPEELLRQNRAELLMAEAEKQGRELTYEEALSLCPEGSGGDPAGAEAQRRRESILDFARAYPELGAEDIPQSVWEDFRNGGELRGLYAMDENRRLRRSVQELEQRERNHFRSTGSRRSAGGGRSEGFEELWNNGD